MDFNAAAVHGVMACAKELPARKITRGVSELLLFHGEIVDN